MVKDSPKINDRIAAGAEWGVDRIAMQPPEFGDENTEIENRKIEAMERNSNEVEIPGRKRLSKW